MLDLILLTAIISLLSSFLLCALYKGGVIEKMQARGNKFIHDLANCQFCLSLWVCGLISLFFLMLSALFCYETNFTFLFTIFTATPLTRKLIQ